MTEPVLQSRPTAIPTTIFVSVAVLFILALMLADQLSKWVVVELYFKDYILKAPSLDFWAWLITSPQERLNFISQDITSFFSMVMVWNRGVGFGLFASDDAMIPVMLGGVAVILSGVFAVWMWRETSLFLRACMAAVIAGALSNAWDRVRFGAVVDFVDLHIGTYHWPAFNLADSLIVVGIVSIAFYTIFIEPARKAVVS